MSFLHFILINVFLGLFYFVYLMLERGKSHFSFNRVYLILAPIVSFLLPFAFEITIENPTWTTILPAIESLQINNILVGSSSLNWNDLLLYLGFFTSIVLIISQLFSILKFSKKSFYKDYKGAKVYLLSDKSESYSFFNSIYLNPNIEKNEEMILMHEYAHCKEHHSLDIIFLSVLKGLLWFNPVIYRWLKKAKENHEFIADNYVL